MRATVPTESLIGGTSVTLHGRVGDVPIYGAALFASSPTCHGEESIREALARTVYQALTAGTRARGRPRAAAALDPRPDVGFIAVDRGGWASPPWPPATLPDRRM